MKEILAEHFSRYPLMQPQDAVKLLYQSEFGGGHMISDPEQSLRRLAAEYENISHEVSLPLTEEIGGGMIRVNLHALDIDILPLPALNELFVCSAAQKKGSIACFCQKIEVLKNLVFRAKLPLNGPALCQYLDQYAAAGYPAVSHSTEYKKAYDPAYRVVCRHLFYQRISSF